MNISCNKNTYSITSKSASLCVLVLLFASSGFVYAQTRGIAIQAKTAKVSTPFVNGTYRALIIGNDQYRDPKARWPSLKTAITDAKAVKNILKTKYGFTDILLLENATRSEILHALSDLSRRAMPKDSVLLYYAGHGFVDLNTNRGYWVPVDAHGYDQTTFLRNSTIRDELSIIASRVQHTLLISDSCFSGTLLRSASRGPKPDTENKLYYQKVANKKSVQILAAGGIEYVDDNYQSSGHSPFTYFLLNELENNKQPLITASELSGTVEKTVANNVKQIPESGVLQGAGDEMGEFIFLKLKIELDTGGIPADKVKVQVQVVPAQDKTKSEAKMKESTESIHMKKAVPHELVFPIPTL